MNLLSWFGGGKKALTRDPFDDRFFGGPVTIGNFIVSPETAVRAEAVISCVEFIAETIGSLPLEFPRRDGKEGASLPLEEVLSYQPNPINTGVEFWSTMAFNAVLRGRAYAEPVVISPSEMELWPLRPSKVCEEFGDRALRVKYTDDRNRERIFGPHQLLRIYGISADGIGAIVPWDVARAAIELANTLEDFGKNYFKNGARPSGVLSTNQTLSKDAITRLKDEFNGNFAGTLNAGKVPVLEQSLEYKPISAVNTDSQYLELRRNQVRVIARKWRIPLELLGESESTKNDEQQSQRLVKYTLRPWLRRIEQAIVRDLLTPEQRKEFKAKFNLDALLRGDSATQWRNAVLARTAGVMSVNELRTKWFNQPRLEEEWADDPHAPLNSNRAADTTDGGMTAPQDRSDA